eukprot:SAG11_NODE_1883_length_4124_cov_7.056149_2_plen_101_part_00
MRTSQLQAVLLGQLAEAEKQENRSDRRESGEASVSVVDASSFESLAGCPSTAKHGAPQAKVDSADVATEKVERKPTLLRDSTGALGVNLGEKVALMPSME